MPYARNFAVPPGSDFWFGSDQLGRDVFARCIYGARVSLLVAVSSIVIGLVVGGLLGIVAGYYRGRDRPGRQHRRRLLLAFPPIVLAILIVGRIDVLADDRLLDPVVATDAHVERRDRAVVCCRSRRSPASCGPRR